ncbi:FAD-dependent oxidoreductase [Candidatus Marinimicrobia bacterium]|nr:FAD-dependent oxidoreductase [Candidatus Neomarinimicrobiota bacterium]
MKKVIIIGSGLSGLSCAHYLDENKYDTHIYEKESTPGGRVNSENIDGNICDVGFQVLLNNYDELKRLNIYNKLDLKYFDSGAQIYTENGTLSLYNPLKHPFKFFKSNIFKIFTISDIFKVLTLFLFKNSNPKETAGQLIDKTFSEKSRKLFFYPFFRGVFLSKDLKNDSDFFLKIFKKFAIGKASLPAKGMKSLPETLVRKSNLNVSYNFELDKIDNKKAIFKNGEAIDFDILILATPLHNISKLIDIDIKPDYNTNKTVYIKSSKNVLSKSILLVPDDNYNINSIQCLSNVSSKYSSSNNSLYSVSTLNTEIEDNILLDEFTKLTNLNIDNVKLIKSYTINRALPRNNHILNQDNCIYFSGDWNTEPSIDGAIKSGRICAEKLN